MKTGLEIKTEFVTKLKALLAEYGDNTELETVAEDSWGCSANMVLTTHAKYNDKGELLQDYHEINLGTWIIAR